MKNVAKFLHMVLAWSLLGAVIMTVIAPAISRVLITAPVSFGMNCEPAADWSMQSLIRSQVIGLVLGALGGIGGTIYFRMRQKKSGHDEPGATKAPA